MEPSDFIVNGISKIDSCKKSCYFEGDFNNITLVFEEEINSCEYMFNGSGYIRIIDLSKFDTSKVTNMRYMFNGCEYLEKIKFGNINTSLVNNMENMFYNCKKLQSLNLSTFNTSLLTDMTRMFYA